MKLTITFLVLISFIICEPEVSQVIPAEEAFTEMKKNILECISKAENTSQELKQYVTESLNSGYKEALNFAKYREKESDNNIIRQCRRNALINPIKKSIKLPRPLTINDNVVPKKDN